jgi:sensor histidine kinase YesM
MRIKSPDDIRFEVHGDINVVISPALFVPLIENAFKYASFRMRKPCVDISLSSFKGIIEFEISNFYENKTGGLKSDHSGYGIINLKKRLDLIYHDKHNLIFEKGESLFNVKLIIDTNAD